MSCSVGCRRGSAPALLWLWRRPAATALIKPLAWEPPYVAGAASEKRQKDKKKKKKKIPEISKKQNLYLLHQQLFTYHLYCIRYYK